MLKFLIGVIIAIILFVPACNFAANFLRTTEQAKTNFLELTGLIKEVNQAELGTVERMIFIQDQKTYIYPLNDKSRNFHVTKDPIFGNDVDFTLMPTNDCISQNCYCLCREYYDEENRNCKPGKLFCDPMPSVNFSTGTGVIIDRGEVGPRRQVVRVIKCGNGAPFCGKSQEGDVSVIFDWVDELGVYERNGIK